MKKQFEWWLKIVRWGVVSLLAIIMVIPALSSLSHTI